MSITKGQTFGVTEQVTNTKLHNLVDQATLSIEHNEFANNVLTSLPTTAGLFVTRSFVTSLASGATIRNDGSGNWYASAS